MSQRKVRPPTVWWDGDGGGIWDRGTRGPVTMVDRQLPTGRVTVLFTDIEGSTSLLRELGERYDHLLTEHFAVVRRVVAAHEGIELRTDGDAIFAVFVDAGGALSAAAEAQRELQHYAWPDDG